MARKKKVTVIGAGHVGATCAQRIVESNLADVCLLDVVDGLAEGKALDMMQSAPVLGFDSRIEGSTDFKKSRGSDVIIITAGLARKPGMSRDDLLKKNAEIMKSVVSQTAKVSPDAVIIVVTNPLDTMCYIAQKYSGFPHKRVIGMAGELDGARFSCFLREKLDPKKKSATFRAVVMGTHGDAMVPLTRFSKVGSKTFDTLLSSRMMKKLVDRTKNGGAEIVGLLKTGSAYYAPSAAAFAMARSILKGTGETYCCSVFLNGEYGIEDTYCGVPVELGRKGIKKIVELKLDDKELKMLKVSSDTIRANTEKVKDI